MRTDGQDALRACRPGHWCSASWHEYCAKFADCAQVRVGALESGLVVEFACEFGVVAACMEAATWFAAAASGSASKRNAVVVQPVAANEMPHGGRAVGLVGVAP
jgi:hypothetical protein